MSLPQPLPDHYMDAEFFGQLPGQGLGLGFARHDLAAGQLPAAG